jgi:hypothetical protein
VVPAGSGRVSRARSYSGSCPGSRRAFAYGAFTLYGDGFHRLPLTRRFVTSRPLCGTIKTGPTTPEWKRPQAVAPSRFGLFPFRSPLLRESMFLSFPPATKMFQFAGLPPPPYVFRWGYPRITTGGFPHSEIPGSKLGQQLPGAYRSRPRPSSAPSAKASIVCSYSLDSVENTTNRYGVFKVRADSRPPA